MRFSVPALAVFLLAFSFGSTKLQALDPPIVLAAPVFMDVYSKNGSESDIRYYGQPAKNGRIDLTATNGFFDACFQAGGPQEALPGDEGLIGRSFVEVRLSRSRSERRAEFTSWSPQPGQVPTTTTWLAPWAHRR